jgi:hypothetical protein
MSESKCPSKKTRKPYVKPQCNKITREQAALLLLGQAWDGDEEAKELLELTAPIIFPREQNPNTSR